MRKVGAASSQSRRARALARLPFGIQRERVHDIDVRGSRGGHNPSRTSPPLFYESLLLLFQINHGPDLFHGVWVVPWDGEPHHDRGDPIVDRGSSYIGIDGLNDATDGGASLFGWNG